MRLKATAPLRLLSLRNVSFMGTEGKKVEYGEAKFIDLETGVVFLATAPKEIVNDNTDLQNNDVDVEFEILQGEKNKPKLRVTTIS